jgi:hypothetical protein
VQFYNMHRRQLLIGPAPISELLPPLGIITRGLKGLIKRFLRREVEPPSTGASKLVQVRKSL